MTVHSTQFAHVHAHAIGQTTVYTVPISRRIILKGVSMSNRAAAANRAQVIATIGGNDVVIVENILAANPTQGDTVTQQIWQVFNAGDVLAVYNAAATCDFLLSGALFTV